MIFCSSGQWSGELAQWTGSSQVELLFYFPGMNDFCFSFWCKGIAGALLLDVSCLLCETRHFLIGGVPRGEVADWEPLS